MVRVSHVLVLSAYSVICIISAPQGQTAPPIQVYKIKNILIPDSIDWRGILVTDVKSQGACEACWAFSALGALEGQHAKATGKLVELSAQHLLDCMNTETCRGGRPFEAFQYIFSNGGIANGTSYPYEGKKGECRFSNDTVEAKMSGLIVMLEDGNEAALKEMVALIGPVSVSIHNTRNFIRYQSGVFYDHACKSTGDSISHAVLLVGYGTDENEGDYWIVKNTWSDLWGEHGYARMARNRNNHCGIASRVMVPVA